jgi:hypothetical protein
METEARTQYSVRRSRAELKSERRQRYVLWGLVGAALVVILVFAALLIAGAAA